MTHRQILLSLMWVISIVKADIINCTNVTCTITTTAGQLDLNNSGLDKYSEIYLHEKVTAVWFESPNLREFPIEVLKFFTNLTVLHASQTSFEVIQPLPNLPKLVTIDLGQNRIGNLTNDLFVNTSACTRLILSHNALDSVAECAFKGLANVKVLKLDHNQLSTLPPDVFVHLERLKFLRLDHNQFVILDTKLFALTERLTDLNFESNPLTEIITPLSAVAIESLKLDNTSLRDVQNLTSFNRLNNLHLSHNPQLHIDADLFAGLSNLRELFMSAMDLEKFAGNFTWLEPLQKLTYLELDDNNLNRLELDRFPRLEKLSTLSLDNNYLTSIEYTMLKKYILPALARIYISKNAWNCSYLKEMTAHLTTSGVQINLKDDSTTIGCVAATNTKLVWTIVIIGLLTLMVGLVVCFIRMRRKRRRDDENIYDIGLLATKMNENAKSDPMDKNNQCDYETTNLYEDAETKCVGEYAEYKEI